MTMIPLRFSPADADRAHDHSIPTRPKPKISGTSAQRRTSVAETTDVLRPGEFGVLIRKDGSFDLLVPEGEEDAPISDRHQALLGAVFSLAGDAEFRRLCEQRYRIEMASPPTETVQ